MDVLILKIVGNRNACSNGVFEGQALPESPFLSFQRLTEKQIKIITHKLFKRKEKKMPTQPSIRCANCKNIITSPDTAISMAGQHRLFFKNPAGIDYEIGCFSAAEGCLSMGEPTTEFSWFPGYSWSYSFCGQCMTHLGWHYQASDHHFYGLILNRLSVEK